ncbi:MAG: hypothetical protein AUJ48_03080 [Deltaproteobacteria bacterium CG1_02_45_11]|nr:MAG: hypothetical protein AUJ48_03080 [Deltaproteobacteria bacterium CG1_02_45_11]
MNLFLIGYRCTGKTTVGKALANILGWPFLDADSELVKEYGRTITEIVAQEGWNSFREKEKSITKKLCALDKHVIASGGGVVLNRENVENMKKGGTIVWLKATPEIIKERITQDETTKDSRPSLTAKGLIAEIEETLAARNPLYEKAMDFCIDTDALSIGDICGIIIKKMNETD